MAASNYEITLSRMPREFLKYDQRRMTRFCSREDRMFLYLHLLDRQYRVSREDGTIEWTQDEAHWQRAGFLDAMTVYDLLCCAKDDAALCGRFCRAENLPGTAHGANPAKGMHDGFARDCDKDPAGLTRACCALGGQPFPAGEISYQLPLFDFLPVVVQFWASDEEFPPEFKLMWDEGVLSFLRYETVCYAAGFLISRLQAHMGLCATEAF